MIEAKMSASWAVRMLIAGLAFLALFCFGLPFPLVIIAAGAYGFWRGSGVAEEHSGALPSWRALAATVFDRQIECGDDLHRVLVHPGVCSTSP